MLGLPYQEMQLIVTLWLLFNGTVCDESSELNQLSGITKASSSRSTTTLNGESVDVKGSTWFQTSSPVSVLETSSACSSAKPAPINPKLSFLVKRDRSKRRRASTFNLQFTLPFISSTGSTSLKKKNLTWLSGSCEIDKSSSEETAVVRKCTHCEVTKTPQWREGPKGPKTLCNACGVRYRSGRLFPEYRPAASPTFVPSLHSNSHKKVIEMRKQCQAAEVGNTIYGVNSTRNRNAV
ncbi:GATA transcription factor 11 [Gossypium hirsutum]|uniref:GATA transcription factor 11 n=1 Tax=Gossypium hirsutum TaxID=3635 RepID=A0ABM3AMB9_GOSHI|nr:GATA transcription factor 11-like [Gossypium hirsutum]